MSKVPQDRNLENRAAIFKKGDKSVALNYWLGSLRSVAGKIFEMILKEKLVQFLDEYNIIPDTQYSFRNKHSCLRNLLGFFPVIYEKLDNCIPSDVI